jgi:hypothetical protein
MLAFYVGTGLVLALLVGGWFAWTPLKMYRYEQKVLGMESGSAAQLRAMREVAELGPVSRTVMRRLLANPDAGVRVSACRGLHLARQSWAVPLLIRAALDPEPAVAGASIAAVVNTADIASLKEAVNTAARPRVMLIPEVGKRYTEDLPVIEDTREVESLRSRLVSWWEREGKAKYGGSRE